ncbi:MAG: DUF2569 family protein [Bacillota bacterium]
MDIEAGQKSYMEKTRFGGFLIIANVLLVLYFVRLIISVIFYTVIIIYSLINFTNIDYKTAVVNITSFLILVLVDSINLVMLFSILKHLFKRSTKFIELIIRFLYINLAFNLVKSIAIAYMAGYLFTFTELAIVHIIYYLAIAIVALLYFKKSKRVKSTFIY